MRRITSIILTIFLSVSLFAQKSETLLTIGKKKISAEEFSHIYQKNNSSGIGEKSIDDYLELFVSFKLKVTEAESLKMDTSTAFKNEFKGYYEQLAKPYLIENEKYEDLAKESYERGKIDAKLDIIFVRKKKNASPEDTLLAYNKALNIRKRIMNKEEWNKVASETSDDKSVARNKGHLSYISLSKIPAYSIQNFIFNAKNNELSMPLNTKFGYYIVRLLDKRPNPGEITVSHIMIMSPESLSKEEAEKKKKKIDSIYERLKNGDDFVKLSKLSDDKGTSQKGGKLPTFSTGRMVPEFEKAAFSIKKTGDISKPVKTNFGWHIIKLNDKKPYPEYEKKKKDLRKQVKKDSEKRKIAENYVSYKLKNKFDFKENKQLENFYECVDSTIFKAKWKSEKADKISGTLFEINNVKYDASDFAGFLENNQKRQSANNIKSYVDDKYKKFVYASLVETEKNELTKTYPEFGYLMQEYRDGMLLFDLTKKEVWDKATADSTGLKKFYDENTENYSKQITVEISAFKYGSGKYMKKAKKLLKKSKYEINDDELVNKISNDPKKFKKETSGKFKKGDNKIADKILDLINKGKIIENQKIVNLSEDKTLVHVKNISKAEGKPFNEIKGTVTADYQNYLEQKWVEKLNKKYPVKINKKVLEKVKRKMKK